MPIEDGERGVPVDAGDASLRHRVYRALRSALTVRLSRAHKRQLRKRGLSDDEIKSHGYFSVPPSDAECEQLVTAIVKQFGRDAALRVPGFYLRRGSDRVRLGARRGALAIPVRSAEGKVVSIILRIETDDGRKYVWLSAPRRDDVDGVRSGAPCHVPRHSPTADTSEVRVTEGALKADVATRRTGVLTLGVAGVASWRSAMSPLGDLGAKRVLLAFDRDAETKPAVASALADLAAACRESNVEVVLETWPEVAKGIDDVLVAPGLGPGAIQRHEGAAATDEIARIVMAAGGRPTPPKILVNEDMGATVTAAVASLARHPQVFRRGEGIVHLIQASGVPGDAASEVPRVGPVSAAVLATYLSESARWVSPRRGDEVPVAPPHRIVEAVRTWPDLTGIRPIAGVLTAPTLRDDGSLISRDGYDRATSYYLRSTLRKPLVAPEQPTQEDAEAACKVLYKVVQDFPFADEAHFSACIAALLTIIGRHLIDGPTPLFLIDAPVRGSGKTLLVHALTTIALGRPVHATPPAHSDDEERKRITSIAVQAEPIVLLDNLAGPLGSPALDAALTSLQWSDRLLGSSAMVALPLRCVWFATGNNVQLRGDMGRRVLLIRLEPRDEDPERRANFRYRELLKAIRKRRHRLVGAALTILRAYILAGRPSMAIPAWGSFEAWSRLIRGAIVWAGLPDPAATRDALREKDPENQSLPVIFQGLKAIMKLHNGQCTAVQILAALERDRLRVPDDRQLADLDAALCESLPVPDARLPNANRLGKRLRSLESRIVDGMRLRRVKERGRGQGNLWRIEQPDGGKDAEAKAARRRQDADRHKD